MITSATARNTTDCAAKPSNCPFPNAQGCSSGRKQSVWPLLALSSFILHNAGSASRLLSKSFTAISTLLVRVTWLWSNHDGRIMHGRIMFQKPGSIHCTEIGCKYWEWAEKIAVHTLSAKEIGYGKTALLKAWQKIGITFDSLQLSSYPPSGDFCQVS